MLNELYEKLGGASSVSVIIISVALMLMCGFIVTRLTKLLHLPNVTAYIIAGIVMGPFCLDLVPSGVTVGMSFISDLALALISFSVGEFFRFSTLKRVGAKVIVITLFEALVASVLVFVLTYFVLKLGFVLSLLLSVLASATAPTSTMMTIRQSGAKGKFVDNLLSVIALDDALSLLAFSVAISLGVASIGGTIGTNDVLLPLVYNVLLIGIGVGLGFLLKVLMQKRSDDNRLIVTMSLLLALCGIGAALNVSPLLACMSMGMVYINITNDSQLFKQVNYFAPPILLLFYVRSGLNFRLDIFTGSGSVVLLAGVLFFVARSAGKYLGSFLGGVVTKSEKNIRNYTGLALIPNASVAIGLSAIASRVIGGEEGSTLESIVLLASIIGELVGPALANLSLRLSGSLENNDESEQKTDGTQTKEENVRSLKEQLLEIQSELDKEQYARSEEEAAFLEAEDNVANYARKKFINRR